MISSIPLLALSGISIIFCWLVGYGWYRTFNSWTGVEGVSIVIGILIALIANILALAIAKERQINPDDKGTAFSYFFVLVLLSSLGTINTLYFNISGISIAQNDIKAAIEKVSELKVKAPILLATPSYDEWKNKVDNAWLNLQAEIRNPKLCGQGPEALKRISELQILLPSFKMMAGSSGCDRTEQLITEYGNTIEKQKELSREYQNAKVLLESKKYIEDEAKNSTDRLTKLLTEVKHLSDISLVKTELNLISSEYSKMKDRLEAASSKKLDQNFKIDTAGIQSMGNPGEIISFIATRLNEVNTYVYILIALLIDITLITAFRAVINHGDKNIKRISKLNSENYI